MRSILTQPPLLLALSIHIFITFHLHLLPSLYPYSNHYYHHRYGAHASLIVNTDDELIEMQKGREDTSQCSVPTGLITSTDGDLLAEISAIIRSGPRGQEVVEPRGYSQEVYAVLGDNMHMSAGCKRMASILEQVSPLHCFYRLSLP